MIVLELTIVIFLLVGFSDGYKCNGSISDIAFNRDTTGLLFEPLVTFEDSNNLDWYDNSGFKVLLKQIHTKFDKVLVDFSIRTTFGTKIIYSKRPTSLPIIAAEINKERNEFTSPLEIIIVYYDNFAEIIEDVNEIQNVVRQANDIFPGTVKRIIFRDWPEHDNLRRLAWIKKIIFLFSDLEVGLPLSVSDCFRYYELKNAGLSNLIKIVFIEANWYFDNISALGRHQRELENCKSHIQNISSDTSVIFLGAAPDTDSSGNVNYSRLVEYYTNMNDWANKKNSTIIFESAFDTHTQMEPRSFQENQKGWWRVKPNGSYRHPFQFIFEEKACLKDKLEEDKLLLSFNLTWLQQKLRFNSSFISVLVNPFEFNKNRASSSCHEGCFKKYVHFLSTQGIKNIYVQPFPLYAEDEELGEIALNSLLDAVASLNSEGHEPVHLNLFLTRTLLPKTIFKANQINRNFSGTVESLVQFPATKDHSYNFLNQSINFNNDKSIRFGYLIKLEQCVGKLEWFYTALELYSQYGLTRLVLDGDVLIVERKRGFDVLFKEFKARASMCINHLRELNITAKIIFITGWPTPSDLHDHYDFVRYWENVIEWGEQTNTHFILNSAFDSEKIGGWWKPQLNTSGIEELELETQKESLHKRVVEEREKLEKRNILEVQKLDKVWIYVIIGVVMFACGIIIPTVIATFLVRRKRLLSKNEMDDFFEGSEASEGPKSEPYNRKKYEIGKGLFSISSQVLGSGSHGKVFLGRVNENQVAVKTGSKTKDGFHGILAEIKVLAYLGKHENIIELIAVNTCGLKRRKILVFLELCGLGSLERYLREKGKEYYEIEKRNGVAMIDSELQRKLMQWAFEIGRGMEYIASKRIVHLDLATRNILLTDNEQVKISDFCLSQYLNETYAVTNENALPWRWMAPECFRNFSFTEKSDVWAFGVTLWEIFTLGDLPYGGGQSFDEEFTTALTHGLRLCPPLCNRSSIYEVMKSCWHAKPEERPEFAKLKLILKKMLEEEIKAFGESAKSIYDVL